MTSWKKAYEQCKAEGKALHEPSLNDPREYYRSIITTINMKLRQSDLAYITFLGLYYNDKVGVNSHARLGY